MKKLDDFEKGFIYGALSTNITYIIIEIIEWI